MQTFKKIMKWIGIVPGALVLIVIVVRIILDIVFGIELRATLRELKAQGRPLTYAEFVPPPVPDTDNAALLMKEAMELIPAQTNSAPSALKSLMAIIETNAIVCTDITSWTDAQREEGARLIQSNEVKEWYTLLEKAAQRPHFNNNLDWSRGPDIKLMNLGLCRRMLRVLAVKAGFEGQGGNLDQAMDNILTGLKLSNKLGEEPALVTQLARVACDLILIGELERLVDAIPRSGEASSPLSTSALDIPAEPTRALIAELALHTDMMPWRKSMDVDRVGVGMWIFDHLISGSPVAMYEFLSLSPDICPRLMAWTFVVIRPVLKKDYIVYLKLVPEIQRRFEIPYYQIADIMKQKPIEERIPSYAMFSRILLSPSYEKVRERVAVHQAEVEVCRVGLALKLFKQKSGAYPDVPDKLAPEFMESVPVDPFTGKPLVYRKAGDGFLLYSLGPNLKDDSGKPRSRSGQAAEDTDIVWKCEK
ncbi:MAG: hypothetical protein KKE37_05300 [Verrucomicrobia bacterium]|nr:hypothetical protein [Verrucomicrobiota bacterium]MBU4292180.1 hypothetical protein [Verrucomicrobiota bacterium]MBU4428754.1 hypothetical protein [Verrucomicrobiota bacterium]MCG2681624.1 hypothetical protein [Kiritimatiellia bacterium]